MSALRSDDDGAILRVLFGVIAADEVDAEEGVASVCTAYQHLTDRMLTDDEIARGRDRARSDTSVWLDAARLLALELDEAGKQRLLAAAFEVALADGFVLDEEDRVLATLAAALGMSEHDYRTAVDKLMAAAH